ncbi:MAG: hypothetical protein O9264_03295 [Leptospira sp.]|nr:hypothetical protein [Leptospira sp.]
MSKRILNNTLFGLLLMLSFPSCRPLSLNNPGDFDSKSNLQTRLFQLFLQSLMPPVIPPQCPVRSTPWTSPKIGSGNTTVRIHNVITLNNGDVAIIGNTLETLPNMPIHKNTGFIGTQRNVFLLVLSIETGEFKWVDYLGETLTSDSGNRSYIAKFSNGDIAVVHSTTAGADGISGAISGKASNVIPSVFVARYSADGERKWHTYLDSARFLGESLLTINSEEQIHIFASINSNTTSYDPFGEFPAPLNSAFNTPSQNVRDFIHAKLSGDGSPIAQAFVGSSSSSEEFFRSVASDASGVYLIGTSQGNINGSGFGTNPASGYSRPFVAKFKNDLSTEWVRYPGAGSATNDYSGIDLSPVKDGILAWSTTYETFGSPTHPYVGPGLNHALTKYSTTGAMSWNYFLGYGSNNVEIPFGLPYLQLAGSDTLYSYGYGSSGGTRYSGFSTLESGTTSNPYPIALKKVNGATGTIEKINYSENLASPSLKAIQQFTQSCSGLLISGQSTLPDTAQNSKVYANIIALPKESLP